MAAANARRAIRQAKKAQLDEKEMDARRYQMYYLTQERAGWFENPEDITEEIFEPQNEVSPVGWWPALAQSTPRISMTRPQAEKLQSELERTHRMKHAQQEA